MFEKLREKTRPLLRDVQDGISDNYRKAIVISVVVFAVYAASLWAAASSTLAQVSNFQPSNLVSGEVSTSESIEMATLELESLSESAAKTWRVATPVFLLCDAAQLIPAARRNCDGARSLFERFEHDKDAAILLLTTVQIMNGLMSGISAGSTGSNGVDIDISIAELSSLLVDFDTSMEKASALDKPDGRFVIPQVSGAFARTASAEQDLKELAAFVWNGVDVLDSSQNLEEVASGVFESLSSGSGAPLTFSDMNSALSELDPLVRQLRADIEKFDESTPNYIEGATVHKTILSVTDDANLIIELILALSAPIDILDDSLAVGRSKDGSLLTNGGLLEILDNLSLYESELENSAQSLIQVSTELAERDSLRRLLGPDVAGKLNRAMDQYLGLFESINQEVTALRLLLGSDEPRKYLVLGQSSDELRPAGGFTSSVWLMTIDNGGLAEVEYIDVMKFGEAFVLADLPEAPDDLKTYMDTQAWYLRDVGWSPDFQSVGELAAHMNESTGRALIDGVISMTTWGFTYLVHGIGSIDTPDGELSGAQVMGAIEEQTDTQGTVYLKSMFDYLIDSFTIEKLEGNFVGLARWILRALSEKQIMIYSSDAELQAMLVDLNWAGTFEMSHGDLVGVYDSNIGWNKVGRNIVRDVKYQLTLKDNGGGSVDLSISHENRSSGDGSSCDSQAEPTSEGNRYHLLTNGCYWNLLRVYTPLGAEGTELPFLGAPESSVAVRSGALRSGEDTTSVYWDTTGQYFRGLLALPPGETSVVEYQYELPPGTSVISGGMLEYNLSVPIQAGVPDSNLSIQVSLPVGYEIVETTLESQSTTLDEFIWEDTLDSDIGLRILAKKVE